MGSNVCYKVSKGVVGSGGGGGIDIRDDHEVGIFFGSFGLASIALVTLGLTLQSWWIAGTGLALIALFTVTLGSVFVMLKCVSDREDAEVDRIKWKQFLPGFRDAVVELGVCTCRVATLAYWR